MSAPTLHIEHSINIPISAEELWDFTQDYSRRSDWDYSVKSATLIAEQPSRSARLELHGGDVMTFIYKLDERPRKTSLEARDIKSLLVSRAAGWWEYEQRGNLTVWTQANTIVLKDTWYCRLIAPVFRRVLHYTTQLSMKRAARLISERKSGG